MSILVVVPTYNERENIKGLIQNVLKQDPRLHVLVVDDDSPDHTGFEVETLIRQHNKERLPQRVHLILRTTGKSGRGSAVRAGFEWGLKTEFNFQYFIEMDSDFSHKPEEIKHGIALLESADPENPQIVLGSRYQRTSKIIGWPASRRVFSHLANGLAKTLIGNMVSDFTNGFRFYNRLAVEVIVRTPQKHKGYIYLSEALCELVRNKTQIQEFPTIFENRTRGESNTSLREIRSALGGIFSIAIDHRLKKFRVKRN